VWDFLVDTPFNPSWRFGEGDYTRHVFATLLPFAATCTSQEFRATISGRITDAQNSVVPSVRTSVVQIGTEAKFETASDHEGLYTVPFQPPAAYRLTAEALFKR
jgi:Carboxypeptidase regulatory-like domain